MVCGPFKCCLFRDPGLESGRHLPSDISFIFTLNFLDFTCLHKQHTKGGGEKFSVPDPQNPYFNDPAACFNTNEDYTEKEIEE